MSKKLKAAEEREKAQAIDQEKVSLVHVGDLPVDLRRFRVQCQKYFYTLRVVQLKNHCIKDKSPASFVVSYKDDSSIDIQVLLDKGAAIESQDETYLCRSLDTYNKGHFHSHKLLLPWTIKARGKRLLSSSRSNTYPKPTYAVFVVSQVVLVSAELISSHRYGSRWET